MSTHSNPLRTLARYRDLRWLFVAGVVSDIGTWMQAVTVGTLVAVTSKSAGATALVMSVMFLPQGLCSPFGGLLADRFDRRRLAMVLLAVQTVLAGVLAVLVRSGVHSPLALAAVILVQGCANALANPALQSITPQLVSSDDLLPALSLGAISWNSGRILGPTLAAVCTVAWGPSTTIMANAISFVVPIVALAAIRKQFHGGGHVQLARFLAEMRDAGRMTLATPSIRAILPALILTQVMWSALLPALPFYGRNVLGGGGTLVTALFVSLGAGAMLAGAFASAITARVGRSSVVLAFVMCLSVGTAGASLSHTAWQAVASVAVFGCGITGFFVATSTIVQRDASESQRGRLVSIYAAVSGLAYGLGAPVNGWIADHTWGLRTHLMVWAIALALITALARRRHPEWDALLEGSDATPTWRRAPALVS